MTSVKTTLLFICISFVTAATVIVATTPLHEAAHVAMSTLDPYINVVDVYFFDIAPSQNNHHILSSPLGYVVVKEAYPGAFNERPLWADILQEILCILVQIIIACIVVFKLLVYITTKHPLLLHV